MRSSINDKKNSIKLKKLKQRTFAANYLANITLNAVNQQELKTILFENLINKNDFDCFLSFNRIETTPHRQNEFFNFYKQKLCTENRLCCRTSEFLRKEFNSKTFVPDLYVQRLLQHRSNRVPEINIEPSLSMSREVNLNKISMSDPESDHIKSEKDVNILQLGTSNMTLSSNSSVSTSIPSGQKFSQSISNAYISAKSKITKKKGDNPLTDKTRNFKRTISESSNESYLNSSLNRNGTFFPPKSSKPSLLNNLKRITNEKILMTSNGSPIGVFSRLPFRFTNQKIELNDSIILKNRHASLNKNNMPQNNFIIDVFSLLDLDFDDYVNSGIMSYVSLVDPKSKSKKLNDDPLSDQLNEEIEDKEDSDNENCLDKFLPTSKKDTKLYNLNTYQADYLDDPQLTEMTAGKNRTCLKFASYAVSIIDYVKPLDLKKEINETFKEKFPYIQITLTKLRSIKREMMEIAYESCLDLIIVAQAYIYYEKLILQGLINKTNRKYLAANCLIIASKLNDVTKKDINKLIDNITNKFRFDNRKDVVLYEFPILVALEFNLIVKYESDFLCHYERLMNNMENLKLNNISNTNNNVLEPSRIHSFQRTLSD